MISLREVILSITPGPIQSALRPGWRKFFRFQRRVREWWIPCVIWVGWVMFQCIRRRKRAVIICRMGGIGDVVCTLPVCEEIRCRHPGTFLIFLTSAVWREVVVMSHSVDLVYANKTWGYPFTMPTHINAFGFIDAIYNPQTTGEKQFTSGMARHLVDDLAASCGVTLSMRQPKLYPSQDLVEKIRIAYGLNCNVIGERLVIAINPGPSWRIKEWVASKWQSLIEKIHSEYDSIIIQFGTNKGDGSSEYDALTGVKSLVGRLKGEELVALIAISDLVISIDSGPVHIAGAVGTPVVGLFGPLNPALVLPPDAPAVGLFSDVPCLFCHNRTPVIHWFDGCPYDIACMETLSPDTVFESTKTALARYRKREATESLQIS